MTSSRLPTRKSNLFELYLILTGVLSPADPGVLEQVAITRSTYFGQVQGWREYEVLVAVESCALLGRDGWLITSDSIHRGIVVDCMRRGDSMNGIMCDTTLEGIREGWLVLR